MTLARCATGLLLSAVALLRCSTGVSCAGATVKLASGLPAAIAVDATTVYWVDETLGDKSVKKLVLPDGATTTLAKAPQDICALAVAAGVVYFTDVINGTVMSVPASGGVITTIASGEASPVAIAVDDTSVYWANRGGAIRAAKLPGGPPVTLAPAPGPESIAVAAGTIYFGGAYGVMQLPVAGGAATPLSDRTSNAGAIALDAASVYWIDHPIGLPDRVYKAPHGGGPSVLLATGQDELENIATDGQSVYFTDPTRGAVFKVAVGGGEPTALCTSANPLGIAVDASRLYLGDFALGLLIAPK